MSRNEFARNATYFQSKSPPGLEDVLKSKALEGIVLHGITMNQAAAEQGLGLKKRIENTVRWIGFISFQLFI